MFFPSLPLSFDIAIKIWRIEVVEAQVKDLVSPIRRSADRGCHYVISDFINRNIFSYPINVQLNEY